MVTSVRVKCKRCGNLDNSEDFVLDPFYKLVVCPSCIKERKVIEGKERRRMEGGINQSEEKRPAGYDEDDAYIERRYKEKMQNAVVVKKVSDEKVQYQCPKCKYNFLYDLFKKTPAVCPYCSKTVSTLRF